MKKRNRRIRVRQILRARREQKRALKLQVIGNLETLVSRIHSLGYSGAATDHVSRLRIREETLGFLLRLEYYSISELVEDALARRGLFRVRREWESKDHQETMLEVLDAIMDHYGRNAELLKRFCDQLAKGN